MSRPAVASPRSTEDWERYELLAARCFNETRVETGAIRDHAVAHLATSGTEVLGGVLALRCDLHLGGRPVPAGAVAGVCVAPEARGRGLAAQIMAEVVAGLKTEGRALGILWTPAVGVYRRWGWEVGGLGRRWRVPLSALRGIPRSGRLEPGISPAAAGLQARLASGWNCSMRRPSWWWSWKYPENDPSSFLFRLSRDDGEIGGLVGYTQRPAQSWGYDLVVSDFWAADGDAARALHAFLAGQSSQARALVFDQAALAPTPHLLWEMPQHEAVEESWYPWMLRVLDVPAAFDQRGWPAHVAGSLEFAVVHQDGSKALWKLSVEDGRAAIAAGGAGSVVLTENSLAAWYAGALHGPQLRQLLPAGTGDRDIDLMTTLTAGAGPWLPDVF